MDKVIIRKLNQIKNSGGDIYHVFKKTDKEFKDFGEAYFSFINQGCIKGWKKHKEMTLNLVVPIGKVKFVIYCENSYEFTSYTLSPDNYQKLTIPPNFWLAFKGLDKNNIILNIADIEHNPAESINKNLEEIPYKW